jgi:site-specific recombinase XerD
MSKQMTPLRRRMIDDMTIRNMSSSTQKIYVRAVANFSIYHGCSPEKLTSEDVRDYRLHLISRGLKPNSINPIMGALRFFYRTTLGLKEVSEQIPYARRADPLPAVLARDEVARFLKAATDLKMRTAFTTIYAAGLRVSEAVKLTARDIDSARMVIAIRQSKGRKDRYVMLSEQLLGILRAYWRQAHLQHLLFPGPNPSRPITTRSVERACRKAAEAAGLDKTVTVHTLRHNAESRIMPSNLAMPPRSAQTKASVRSTGP